MDTCDFPGQTASQKVQREEMEGGTQEPRYGLCICPVPVPWT